MADYSFCKNKTCAIRERCARFLGVPGRYQSYSAFESGKTGCESFIKVEDSPFETVKVMRWRWVVKNTRGQHRVTSLFYTKSEIKLQYPRVIGRIEEEVI